MVSLSRLANKISEFKKLTDWDSLRDICDLETQGDLDTFQLDLLTDMVMSRIKRRSI